MASWRNGMRCNHALLLVLASASLFASAGSWGAAIGEEGQAPAPDAQSAPGAQSDSSEAGKVQVSPTPPDTSVNPQTRAADSPANTGTPSPPGSASALADGVADPLYKLGVGDVISVQVYGQPEMSATTTITDDGSISVPLVGAVAVSGLSPAQAAERVASALRNGQFLVNPQVNITLTQYKSQRVSVLGEVHTPGRYPIESRTTVFDLLAQAGGTTDNGADVIYLIRPDGHGNTARYSIDLKDLGAPQADAPLQAPLVKGGDSIFVPQADHFYVYGEVQQPNMYRLEPGMMVIQAISRSGGITARGSDRRIQIKRRDSDGKIVTLDAEPSDLVQPNDVIRVKERIF